MARQESDSHFLFNKVAIRILGVMAAWLVIWHSTSQIGTESYLIAGVLLFSNLPFLYYLRNERAEDKIKLFFVADGVLLPLIVAGVEPVTANVQIVFIISILLAMVSSWRFSSFLSLSVVVILNVVFALSGKGEIVSLISWLVTHFCISLIGLHISSWFLRRDKEAEYMSNEINKREIMLSKTAETISYWMNIYETAVRNIPSGIVLFDTKLRLVLVNDSFSTLVGQVPSDLINRTPSQYFPEKVIGELKLREKLQKVIDEGLTLEAEEIVLTTANEKQRVALFRAFPVYDTEGTIKYVLGVFDEITEIREAQKKREKSEKRYLSLFTNIPDAIAVFSLTDGSLLSNNKQLEDLTGFKTEEFKNMSFEDIFAGKKLPVILRQFINKVSDPAQSSAPLELRMISSSGKELDVEVILEPFPEEEDRQGIQVIIRDITARKKAEAEAIRRKVQARMAAKKLMEEKKIADELRKLDNLKSEFVSMASHELRTPMTSIKGALSMLQSIGGVTQDKEQIKWVEMALRNVDRLTVLLNETLDVAKIEAGKFTMHPKDVNMNSLLEQVVEEYSIKAAEMGHELCCDSSSEAVTAYVDSDAIKRVFINLIGNAMFHNDSKVRIGIRIKYEGNEETVRVEVEDDGQGIAPKNLDKIFEKFYQAECEDGNSSKGTGLGLPICKGLIEQMGGNIWVESEPGKGATFVVLLPKNKDVVESKQDSN